MAEEALERILFVAGVAEPRGTSTYTALLLKELRQRGHPGVLATVDGPMVDEYQKLDVQVHVLPKLDKPRSPFFPRQQLAKLAREAEPDLVHIQSLHALGAGLVAGEAADVPAILTVHMPPEKRRLRKAMASVDGIIAVSQAVREHLVNKLKIPKEAIQVIPNGLDLSQHHIPASGTDSGVPIIATAGPLEPQKAQADFLSAAARILEAGHNAQFLVIGDGPQETALRQHAVDLGIQKQVTFVTGVTNYRQAISTCDIFVLPSLMEGLGLSVLQAMAFAKPVVTTNAGGLCLIVRDGENGLMVQRNDSAAIAAAVCRLIDDPRLAAGLGARARQFVEAEFSIAACVDKTLAYMRSVLRASAEA